MQYAYITYHVEVEKTIGTIHIKIDRQTHEKRNIELKYFPLRVCDGQSKNRRCVFFLR